MHVTLRLFFPVAPRLFALLLMGAALSVAHAVEQTAGSVPAEKAAENPPAKPAPAPPAEKKDAGDSKAAPAPDSKTPPAPMADDEAGEEEIVMEDEAAAEDADAERAAVALPVAADPVQVFGWRERVRINGIEEPFQAKLDTGALTSSIHAEDKELFERDGRKWVRFFVTDTRQETPVRTQLEARLVRVARIKEPGGESVTREVVRLNFQIGDRTLRSEFTLNNRGNMLAPVLIGRSAIKELGWVDSSRTYLADEKIFR